MPGNWNRHAGIESLSHFNRRRLLAGRERDGLRHEPAAQFLLLRRPRQIDSIFARRQRRENEIALGIGRGVLLKASATVDGVFGTLVVAPLGPHFNAWSRRSLGIEQ